MPSTRFQLVALPATNFEPLFALDAAALADRHIQRLRADEGGHLCRVTLADVAIGDDLLLLSYQHHGAASPYRAAGPIFVGVGAKTARLAAGEIPDAMRAGLFSLKAYDHRGDIVAADVVAGTALEQGIDRFLSPPGVDCLHIHFARRGCYACRVERAD